MTYLKLLDVHKSLGKDMVLDGLSLEVSRASSLAIVGRSGSGKTTLLSILGLLDGIDSGKFEFDNVNVESFGEHQRAVVRRANVGFIFQRFALFPRLSALDNVMLPLMHDGTHTWGESREMALEVLDELGLSGMARRKPEALSGGEQQRVAVARALVTSPEIVIADEPTGALDQRNTEHVLEMLLSGTRNRNTTLILATHDAEVARKMDRIVELRAGRVHG